MRLIHCESEEPTARLHASRPAGDVQRLDSKPDSIGWLRTSVSEVMNSHEIVSFHLKKDSRSGCSLQGKAEQ